ncbi:hypothetical protein [Staphylococcus equorum]|uniref:hypothetical protein n=1 Tax=Staphylococcus equorum TaxID=246432 RepID=UPI003593EBD5
MAENKNPQTTHGSEQNEALNKITDHNKKPGIYIEIHKSGKAHVYGVGGDGVSYTLLDSR